ncbi:MAG TPA: glycerol-3-phosphate dehydrogenase/oxidase [Verrucomicrobiae bacterium]
MTRDHAIAQLRDTSQPWDILIIGGGATGLGAAVESASRGYRTGLVEQHDFAKGTSSRSTKLVHGGVRYLKQGNIALVTEALRERGLLMRNAPHLVQNRSFLVPNYTWWEGPFYGVGLKVYDALAGKLGLGKSQWLSREETISRIPTLETDGLRGGVVYHDGQFDDARLAITLLRTFHDQNGVAANYLKVVALLNENDVIRGALLRDMETGLEFELRAKVVINATGVFVDSIRTMDESDAAPLVTASQGIHLVLDRKFLPTDTAIMVPQTDDGRVLFAVPWHDRVIVGTTDTAVPTADLEPRALDHEIDFVLKHAARYMVHDPTPADVLSVFAGLRPLVRPTDARNTAAISRDHHLSISRSGLITITGGKWTTYRKMGEDTIDQAATVAALDPAESKTAELQLHGAAETTNFQDPLHVYGTDLSEIQSLATTSPHLAAKLHDRLPNLTAEVIWAARHEMARTVEDILARRTRALLLDARASIEAAPRVAELLSTELHRDADWIREQLRAYSELARAYLLT